MIITGVMTMVFLVIIGYGDGQRVGNNHANSDDNGSVGYHGV